MSTAIAGEVLRRDVYPADVLMPDGTMLRGVRVFATSHRLLIYHEPRHQVIELAHALDLTRDMVPGDRNTLRQGAGALQADTADGTIWINAGSGCGCHSPLKGMMAPVSWTGR